MQTLTFDVVDWSSYSGSYHPRHILDDLPAHQGSRWLSESARPPQFLMLQLKRPAVLSSISFGKFHQTHACNVKKLRVYGGLDQRCMALLLESELQNNSEKETMSLHHSVRGRDIPCVFLRIEPLQSWGQTNYSIWFVQLEGDMTHSRVQAALHWLQEYRDSEAVRVCLKHMRKCNYRKAFSALQAESGISLEHPLLTQLHQALVENGDYTAAETLVTKAISDGLLDGHIASELTKAHWKQISLSPLVGHSELRWPGVRGGHQLCVDSERQALYLFGGWDGSEEDLADLWRFDLAVCQWVCLSPDVSQEGGPSARSCHKMCLDPCDQVLYVLGRYLDMKTQSALFSITVPSDFYAYYILTGEWALLSADTHADGGPHLVHDHQMCFNPMNQSLYIFGGKIISRSVSTSGTYSGLYIYHCPSRQWTCARSDSKEGHGLLDLQPRMAHTLVLNPERQQLYIIGGQRDRQPLGDMIAYDIASNMVRNVPGSNDGRIPASGFALLATIDVVREELLILVGMSKVDQDPAQAAGEANELWLYSLSSGLWRKVQQVTATGTEPPCLRYAHQFVYDPLSGMHFMFGGNPGRRKACNMHLDDLWSLKLQHQSRERLIQECQFILRKHRFEELAAKDAKGALHYLQTAVSAVVDHGHPQQSHQFCQLTSALFAEEGAVSIREMRSELFDKITSMFPDEMAPPKASLLEYITY